MKTKNSTRLLTTTLAVLFTSVGLSQAAVVTAPVGLAPGSPYRLLFATSTGIDATSIAFAPYDAHVNSAVATNATLVGLSTTWLAVVSKPTNTSPFSAKDHTSSSNQTGAYPNNIPIYNLQGELIASTYADLWDGSIANAVQYDESGLAVTGSVWTGTAANGHGINTDQVGNGTVQVGNPLVTNNTWIGFNGGTTLANTQLHGVYGMSGTLLAPVPEPSTALLSLLAIGAFGLRRRRK